MSMSKYCTFFATGLLGLAVATPAFANPAEVAVSYKDLNLVSSDGREALDRRLDNAAADVCSAHGTFDLSAKVIERRCRLQLAADARQKAQIVVARAKTTGEVAAAK
jgi:UrcA family protein